MSSSSGPSLPRSADDSTPPPGSDAPPVSSLPFFSVVPTVGDRPPSSVPPPPSGSSGALRFPVSGDGPPPSRHFTGPFHVDRPDRCKGHKGWRSDLITLWDIDNAGLPNPKRSRYRHLLLPIDHILANIKDAPNRLVDSSGMQIKVYGNGNMSEDYQRALSTADGLTFYIVSAKKQAADRKLITDLQLWAIEHPPPAYVFLISGDGDFFDPLADLISHGYSLLLAYSDKCSSRLLELATYALPFNHLIYDVTVDPSALLP